MVSPLRARPLHTERPPARAPAGPRRSLGATGLEVSTLGFGTVELGMDYGLPHEGALPSAPSLDEGVALLLAAFAAGVDLVDTAPGYGRAEAVVGEALARWPGRKPVLATKVPCPDAALLANGPALGAAMRGSLEASLRRLGVPCVDLVQVHNATEEALRSPAFGAALDALIEGGLVGHLGASTYGPEAARAAIAAPWCETLQLAFNVLDQEPASTLIDEARDAGMGIIARSALLKGVLAADAASLPESLRPLAPSLARARAVAARHGEALPALALRFILSDPRVDTVLVGIDRPEYLDADVAAWRAPPLPPEEVAALRAVHVGTSLTDPRTWGF